MRVWRRRSRVLTARHAQARELPPSLSATDVEALPLFGTSWYTRGVSYYLRRVLAVLLLLIPLAVVVTFDVALFRAFDDSSSAARLAWGLVLGVLFLASFVWPLRNLRREQDRRRAGEIVFPNYFPGVGRRPVAGAGLGALARSGSVLAGAFLAVGSVIFLGWVIIAFLETFRHEYRVEHDARLRLQRREKWSVSKRPDPPAP
jgi:hypothetical protein